MLRNDVAKSRTLGLFSLYFFYKIHFLLLSYLFLKLLEAPHFRESLGSLAGVLAIRHEPAQRRKTLLSSEPETDQQNDKKRGQHEPRDHDNFDPQFPNGRNVVVHIRILVKESVTVTIEVRPPIRLMMRKNVAAIRTAGRAAGLMSASMFLMLFFAQVVSQAFEQRHFEKSQIC